MTDLYKLLCMQRPVYLQYEMNAPKSALKCPEQSPSTLTVRPPWRVSRSASSNLLQKPPDQASLCVARTRKGNMAKSGIAVGLNKGHVLTVRDKKIKPSNLKGVRNYICSASLQHSKLVQGVIGLFVKPLHTYCTVLRSLARPAEVWQENKTYKGSSQGCSWSCPI